MGDFVGFYTQVIFPRLCDLLLNRPFVARYRRELLAHAFGEVLEIGFGTGLNLRFYPEGVRKITTVDPNVGMHSLARKRIKQTGIEVDRRVLSGEHLPFDSDTFDCVVSTFTLCSIAGVGQALSEVYRVLKPSGRFLFLEHGLSPGFDRPEVAAPPELAGDAAGRWLSAGSGYPWNRDRSTVFFLVNGSVLHG